MKKYIILMVIVFTTLFGSIVFAGVPSTEEMHGDYDYDYTYDYENGSQSGNNGSWVGTLITFAIIGVGVLMKDS